MNYFIHGKDEALLKEELQKILKNFKDEDISNMAVYDGNTADFKLDLVLEDLNTISLFGDENKIVLLRNPLFLIQTTKNSDQDYQNLDNYFNNPSEFSSLIIYFNEKDLKKEDNDKVKGTSPSSFLKLIKTKCLEKDVKQLDQISFQNRVKNDLKTRNIQIETNALPYLFELLSNDVSLWIKELEKLELYGLPITKSDLPYLITRTLEDKTYELTNAIMDKNLKKCLWIWSDLLSDKTNDLRKLIIMIANNFRKQYEAILLKREMSDEEVAKTLKISSTGQIYHLTKHQKDFPLTKIYYLLDKLAKLDQDIKTYSIDPTLGAELFFIEAVK